MEEPLIGLGLAESREDVQAMIDAVDEDGSGLIEFEEFLDIIQNTDTGETSAKINKFFKDMSNGELGDERLSFSVNVQDIRRKLMMSAILGEGAEKAGGQRILKNVHIQSKQQQMRLKEEELEQEGAL